MGAYFPGGILSRQPTDWFTSYMQTGFAAPGAVAGDNSGVLLFSDAVDGSYLWVWGIDGLTAPSSTVWCQVIEPIFFGVGSRGFMVAPNTTIGPGLVTGLVRPQTLPFGNFFPLFSDSMGHFFWRYSWAAAIIPVGQQFLVVNAAANTAIQVSLWWTALRGGLRA